MSSPFSNLPFKELHGSLPEDFLEELDFFYGTIIKGSDSDYFSKDLWSDKEALGDLYKLANRPQLAKKSEREKILKYQDKEDLKNLADRTRLRDYKDLSREELARKLSRIEWKRSNKKATILAEFLELDEEELPTKKVAKKLREECEPFDHPHKFLKLYQAEVVEGVMKEVKTPNKRLLIQMPTGSGKTRVAMEVISRCINKRIEKRKTTKVLWLAHRQELCDQAKNSFKDIWKHIGRKRIPIYLVKGSNELPNDLEDTCFVIGGLQKLYSIIKNSEDFPKFDIVIIDEAQKAYAKTYNDVIETATTYKKSSRLLGLTATPGRKFGSSTENRAMAEIFHNNIHKIKYGDEYSGAIRFLQKNEFLSRVRRDPINVNLEEINIEFTKEEIESLIKRGEFDGSTLQKLAKNRIRNKKIINKLLELGEEGKKVIYFATSLDQSKLMAALLNGAGFKAAHIDGATPNQTRDRVTKLFVKDELQFLLNYDVFSEGFDSPNTDCVFIARPTGSIVLYSQMIGRGLRGPKLGGNEVCTLVDVVDNITRFPTDLDDIYEYFDSYWGQ